MNTDVKVIDITDIIIPPRRRDDYGDLDALAESISTLGLFHAIVVKVEGDGFMLAAGERRLKACREKLGWYEIPARIYSELSEDERLEIELEENLQRKDLTPLEQSKDIVRLAATAAKVIETNENEFPATVADKSEPTSVETPRPSKGRPAQSVSKDKVAERINVPRSTIRRAEQHVAAVESYPELENTSQKEAIQTAKTLDKLPEKKREAVRSNLKSIKTKAPIPKPDLKSPLSGIQAFILEVNRRGGILNFTGRMTEAEKFTFRDNLDYCRNELEAFSNDLTDYFDELSSMAG
jgi:ParB family chromosome partitioning protein